MGELVPEKTLTLKIILCVKKGPAEWDRLSSIMQFLQKNYLQWLVEGKNMTQFNPSSCFTFELKFNISFELKL